MMTMFVSEFLFCVYSVTEKEIERRSKISFLSKCKYASEDFCLKYFTVGMDNLLGLLSFPRERPRIKGKDLL